MDTNKIIKKIDTLGTFRQGKHDPPDSGAGEACVMEAIAWAAGETWSDCPDCVPSDVAAFLRQLNDSANSDDQRWSEIRPRLPAILSASHDPDVAHRRGLLAINWIIRVYAPTWMRLVPALVEHAEQLEALPEIDDDNATSAGGLVLAAWDAAAAAAADADAAAGDQLRLTSERLRESALDLLDRMLEVR